MTKDKQQDKLINLTLAKLTELGLKKVEQRMYPFEIDTKYGLLMVSIKKDSNRKGRPPTISIYTRFEDPDKAKQDLDCNPYTGKWNWHFLFEHGLENFIENNFGTIVNKEN